jgi:hypothetical protein
MIARVSNLKFQIKDFIRFPDVLVDRIETCFLHQVIDISYRCQQSLAMVLSLQE